MSELADLIAEAESLAPKREGALASWLREHEEASDLFWGVMRDAYKGKGIPFAHCMKAWSKHFPDAPIRNVQTIKRWVDEEIADS